MKNILVFGCNGKLGEVVAEHLSKEYNVIGVDVSKPNKHCSHYFNYSNLGDLELVYNYADYYAVLHCQQVKSKSFMEASLHKISEEEYSRVIDTNLHLSFFSTQKYIQKISSSLSEPKGRIINFTSTYSIRSSNPRLYAGTEMGNPIHYTISKGGLYSLTKYVASYYADYSVLCNSISPHGIENDQSSKFKDNFSLRSPIGRLSEPKELLPAVRFLLDPENTYTNGADIAVDGGWTAC